MNRNRIIGLISLVGLFILAACLLLLRGEFGRRKSGTARLPAVQLSDGRWLQVEHVSFGRVNELHKGAGLIGKLQGWLPGGLRRPAGHRFGSITPSESLAIFLSIDPPPRGLLGGGFKVVSNSGETFNAKWSSEYYEGGVMLMPWLPEFPRNDPSFMLTGTVNRMPVAIEIPNPVYEQPAPD